MASNNNADVDEFVYKILPKSYYETLRGCALFKGFSIDVSDGFIHLSTSSQVEGTLNRFFSSYAQKEATDSLVVLKVKTAALGAETIQRHLKYEAPAPLPHHSNDSSDSNDVKMTKKEDDESHKSLRFPHLYCPLPMSAVVDVIAITADEQGVFHFP